MRKSKRLMIDDIYKNKTGVGDLWIPGSTAINALLSILYSKVGSDYPRFTWRLIWKGDRQNSISFITANILA